MWSYSHALQIFPNRQLFSVRGWNFNSKYCPSFSFLLALWATLEASTRSDYYDYENSRCVVRFRRFILYSTIKFCFCSTSTIMNFGLPISNSCKYLCKSGIHNFLHHSSLNIYKTVIKKAVHGWLSWVWYHPARGKISHGILQITSKLTS